MRILKQQLSRIVQRTALRYIERVDASPLPLDDVIVLPANRAAAFTPAAEQGALMALSHCLAREPDRAVQQLLESAARLTESPSAGLSLEDASDGEVVLRWVAMHGSLSPHLNGTMPRHFSPCGTAIERRSPLVMSEPARHFPYISGLTPPIRAVLLVPFARAGKYVGTVWAVKHAAPASFSREDQRAVAALTTFASAILDAQELQARRAH